MTQETVDHEHQQDDHTDSFFFHDSNDRLLSSSSSCSTSTSDDDTPTPQNDTLTHATLQNDTVTHRNDASINALPQFPFPTMCKYDAWISEPSSLSERRSRLLRQFGLPAPPPSSAAIPRSASSHHCTDTSSTATIPRSKSDNTADRGTKHCKSSVVPIHDNDDGFLVNNSKNRGGGTGGSVCVNNNRICVSVYEDDDEGGGGIGEGNVNVNVDVSNVVDEAVQACTIRDLDNGKEFVVKEDGVWNEVKEVGTGRRLTVEEFEMTVGHSPIVQELMRRQNVEEVGNGEGVDGGGGGGGDDDDDDDEGDGGKVKRKGGWFKFMSLKSVVVGQKERRRRDEKDTSLLEKGGGRRSSSATDDSQDGGGLVHGGERVRVRQYGKSFKEVTGLYRSPEIQAHEGSIWCIKFSLDGKYLASAGEDCVIHVWQVVESERKGELLVEKPEDGNLNIMFLVNGSPEPSSPGMDNNSEKKRRGRLSVSRKSLSLDQLVVPETVFALTDKPVCSFKGHLHDVLDLSWSKSQRLLSSSMDKTVRLWHLSSKSCLKVFSHSDYVTCIQFNPVDDRYFISGSLDAKVRIWSIPDRQVVDWADLHEMVTAACYTPDGQGALVGTYKGRCHLYNTSENKLQQKSQINLQNRKKRSNHKKITGFQVVNGLTAGLLDIRTYEGLKWKKKFVPGSSSEVLITSSDSRIRLVDGIELVHKFKGFRNANSQISACLTANGKYVVSASEDSHVYIWKNEADCRPNRSKGVTVTSTYEHFHCKDVSVAIPWPGMDDTSEMHDSYFAKEPEHDGDGDEDEVSSANHPPTPVEENLGSEGSQFASGCNNSPLHGTIASATDSYFLDRISATWAEEKLLTTRDRSPRVSVDLSNGVNQNMSAWGMVIVTAGLQGEIKIFQNFGLPLGI